MRALLRQPVSVMGALGLLSLAGDLLQWQDHLGEWLAAWGIFSGLVASLLFGWLVERLPWALPSWWPDYVTIGLIVAGAMFRSGMPRARSLIEDDRTFRGRVVQAAVIGTPFWTVAWPVATALMTYLFVRSLSFREEAAIRETQWIRDQAAIFFEFFLWAALIIAINYGLLVTGA